MRMQHVKRRRSLHTTMSMSATRLTALHSNTCFSSYLRYSYGGLSAMCQTRLSRLSRLWAASLPASTTPTRKGSRKRSLYGAKATRGWRRWLCSTALSLRFHSNARKVRTVGTNSFLATSDLICVTMGPVMLLTISAKKAVERIEQEQHVRTL
jgi:hypothetical protein